MHRPGKLLLIGKVGSTIVVLLALLSSCSPTPGKGHQDFKEQLTRVDSLYFSGKRPQSLVLLRSLRPKITDDKNILASYYSLMARYYTRSHAETILYADSALALFPDKDAIEQFPDGYYQSTALQGYLCLRSGKYVTALDYFDKAKKILPQTGVCDDGTLDTQMGVIYYWQKNFRLAARYWLSCYKKLGTCVTTTNGQIVFLRLGALSNAGVSYEQSGMLDSAGRYYSSELKELNGALAAKLVSREAINPTLAVLYDNMGGLYLKLGRLDSARYYLNKCLALPDRGIDGAQIPPLIKLADLDIQTGNLAAAYQLFGRSKKLLDKYRKDNVDSDVRWKRLYAVYLEKIGRRDSVFYYLNQYISRKDTLDKNGITLYRLNVQRELDGIQQQRSLTELSQQDKLKKLYLMGIGVMALLSFAIIYLIYRSLKKERKNYTVATLRNQQLQQTLNELEQANQNYSRIMQVMAHDLRNPLAGMTGLASVLQLEDGFNDESKHMLQLIETTGTHSIEMINELLTTGLTDELEQIVTQNFDLKALLYDSVELLQFKAKEKGQKILFNGPDGPVMANINHEKMWRVFNNLIVNAVKFSHRGGEINVGIKQLGNEIIISVADTGIGIAPENAERIFEMFTPAKQAGTNGEHPFGLGLSITRRIVKLHGGKIWFDSTLGKGTTFYVALPAN